MDMENEGDRSLFRIPLDRVGGLTDEQERVLKEVWKDLIPWLLEAPAQAKPTC